jgi:predicted site-specific integrase-resolvase
MVRQPLTASVFARLDAEDVITPAEVAGLFRVDPKTVTRWSANGWLSSVRTPGGHRRYKVGVVRERLQRPSE